VDHGAASIDRKGKRNSLYEGENVDAHVKGLLSTIDQFMDEEDNEFMRSYEARKNSNAQLEKDREKDEANLAKLRQQAMIVEKNESVDYEVFSPYSIMNKRRENREFTFKEARLHNADNIESVTEFDDSYCVIELDGTTENVTFHETVKTIKKVKHNSFIHHAVQGDSQPVQSTSTEIENVTSVHEEHAVTSLYARRDQSVNHLMLAAEVAPSSSTTTTATTTKVATLSPKERILQKQKAHLNKEASEQKARIETVSSLSDDHKEKEPVDVQVQQLKINRQTKTVEVVEPMQSNQIDASPNSMKIEDPQHERMKQLTAQVRRHKQMGEIPRHSGAVIKIEPRTKSPAREKDNETTPEKPKLKKIHSLPVGFKDNANEPKLEVIPDSTLSPRSRRSNRFTKNMESIKSPTTEKDNETTPKKLELKKVQSLPAGFKDNTNVVDTSYTTSYHH